MQKMTSTINEINQVSELIEKFGGAITLDELWVKLYHEHCDYFSDEY